jgi:hypothetical protein
LSAIRGEFLTDIETLRRRACEHIEEGALTRGYQADRSNNLPATACPAFLVGFLGLLSLGGSALVRALRRLL